MLAPADGGGGVKGTPVVVDTCVPKGEVWVVGYEVCWPGGVVYWKASWVCVSRWAKYGLLLMLEAVVEPVVAVVAVAAVVEAVMVVCTAPLVTAAPPS